MSDPHKHQRKRLTLAEGPGPVKQGLSDGSVVPTGLELFTHPPPALKRWAKLVRPSGAGFQVSPPLLNEHWLGASSKTLESHSTLNDITQVQHLPYNSFTESGLRKNERSHLYLYGPNALDSENTWRIHRDGSAFCHRCSR